MPSRSARRRLLRAAAGATVGSWDQLQRGGLLPAVGLRRRYRIGWPRPCSAVAASWTRGRAIMNEVGWVVEDVPLLAGVCDEGAEEELFERMGKQAAAGRGRTSQR
jgi:hypothetical protein